MLSREKSELIQALPLIPDSSDQYVHIAMADPLSIAAGAAGLISLSGTILAEGYHYIKSVQEAPTQLRCLLSEIAGLNILFDRLQTLVEKESSGQASTAFQALVNSGAITDSLEVLQKIEGLVATCQQVSGQRKRNFGKALFWPLKEGATQTLLARLRRLKDTFTAALSVDTAVVVQRIENQTNAIAQDVSELKCSKDQQEILGWLCPVHVNVEENFENALRLRESGTGNWFFDLPLFHAWTKNSNGLFWISGIPGSGKTVLAATIIEYLRRLGKDIGLAYFFCDHKNRDKQTFRTFLSTIVYQLYEQNASCMNDIEGIYHRLKKGTSTSPTLNLSDLKALLQSISYRFKRTIIVVDALDECQEVAEFARGLQQLATESDGESSSQATVQLLVTSREDLVIETELLAKDGIHISLSREQNVDDDIRLYITNQVEHRLARGILKLRNAHLKAEIISTISDRAGTM